MNDQELYKLLRSKEQAIKENLLTTKELESLQKEVADFLDENLKEDDNNLLYLHYRKFKAPGSKPRTLWSSLDGYPKGGLEWIQPWIDFFEKYLGEKTIKKRLKTDKYWVESRIQGEDEHIFIGERDSKSGDKAHITIDGKTAEIRTDDKDKAPEELTRYIETRLTLPDGKKVRSTREAVEFFEEENKDQLWSDINISVYRINFKGYDVLEIYNSGKEDVENFKLELYWNQPEGKQHRSQEQYFQEDDDPMRASHSSLNLLKRGERKYAANVPNVNSVKELKTIVTGNGVQSGKPFRKEFNL